jgi:hypothetical protein
MSTIFDWVTVAIFGALVVLFLQRSTGPAPASDTILHYFPPALGCALANYLGNEGYRIAAIALSIAVVGYILFVLKPFERT